MPAARLLLAELGLVTAAEALEVEPVPVPVPASDAVPVGLLPEEAPWEGSADRGGKASPPAGVTASEWALEVAADAGAMKWSI